MSARAVQTRETGADAGARKAGTADTHARVLVQSAKPRRHPLCFPITQASELRILRFRLSL